MGVLGPIHLFGGRRVEYPLVQDTVKAPQHFYIRPLSLVVTSRMSNRSKIDPVAEVLNVLHEDAGCELRAVVGNDSVRHTEMEH